MEATCELEAEREMKQMMAHREQHHRQLANLREEISEKQGLIDGLKK